MSALIATLLFIVAVYFLARHEAYIDSEKIKLNITIYHKRAFIERAIIVGFAALVAALFMGWPSFFLLIIGGAFGFSGIFRWYLNKYRGLNRFYVSPSNHFDWMFIKCATRGLDRINSWVVDAHDNWFTHVRFYEEYRAEVHRAGRIAYITEAVITLACLTIHILTL